MNEPLECQCMGCGIFSDRRFPFQCPTDATGDDMLCDGCRNSGAKAGETTGGEYTALVQKFIETHDNKWLQQADQLARERLGGMGGLGL